MSEAPGLDQELTAEAIQARILGVKSDLKVRSRALARVATALTPLVRPAAYVDLRKFEALVAKIHKKVESIDSRDAVAGELLEDVASWRRGRHDALREQLGRDLKTACEAAGFEFRAVRREPMIEVRIPPVAVVIDFDRGTAELRFAREALSTCPAEPRAIVAAVKKARGQLDGSFVPAEFFDRCLAAWKAVRVATGAAERVDLLDFLPYLAIGMQKPRFRSAPTRENFASYSRAQFAFDVLRLGRRHGFVRDGLRLNLGAAADGAASEEERGIHFEDENGNGEHRLSVFFTKDSGTG